jgi:hypothetical protein
VDDQIVIEGWLLPFERERFLRINDQLPERDAEMMGIDELFSFEFE